MTDDDPTVTYFVADAADFVSQPTTIKSTPARINLSATMRLLPEIFTHSLANVYSGAQEFRAVKLLATGCFGLILIAGAQSVQADRLPLVVWHAGGFFVERGKREAASQQGNRARIRVTGTRVSKGTAVDCPQIRTDDGQIYSISYLAPTIAVGDRVEVTGVMANSATCLGPVLKAEKVIHQK